MRVRLKTLPASLPLRSEPLRSFRHVRRVPSAAAWLAVAGVVPFVSGAIMLWFGSEPVRQAALALLLGYSAVILAFLGAVHWGVALILEGPQRTQGLIWSTLPALLAWLALALPARTALAALILGFAATYLWDRNAVNRGRVPAWYARLRLPLTVAVIGCLAASAPMADADVTALRLFVDGGRAPR